MSGKLEPAFVRIPAEDLLPNMWLDLEGDPEADPKHDRTLYQEKYVIVVRTAPRADGLVSVVGMADGDLSMCLVFSPGHPVPVFRPSLDRITPPDLALADQPGA